MAYSFINPYNFIPLGEKCYREFKDTNEYFTGYMKCSLKTRTPLIMMDTEKVEYKDIAGGKNSNQHKIYADTFQIDGVPTIPGSELRGMIRSKYEALTSSCMSSAEENLDLVGRYKGSMSNAGLLDLTDPKKVVLYKCDKVVVEGKKSKLFNDSKYHSGDLICFTREPRYSRDRKKLKNDGFKDFSQNGDIGYLRKGEFCAGRTAVHIFVKKDETVEVSNKKDLYKMFLLSKDKMNENLGHNHKALVRRAVSLDEYSKKSSEPILQPVWYEIVDDNVYLSIGQNGQVRYNRVLKDLIPEEFRPCKNKEHLCEACRVFGVIAGQEASHGKVRVEDATMCPESLTDYYDKQIVLQELASPKFNNARFYMRIQERGKLVDQSTGYNWTSDFKSKFRGGKNGSEEFAHNENVMIRGRKEYWHHDPKKMEGYNSSKITKRNITVRPVKGKKEYEFRVYFDELTKDQLEHLNMAVSLGNNSDLCHKLGLGKPLGYGSVKVTVNEIWCRKLEKTDSGYRYFKEKYIPECNTFSDMLKKLKVESDIQKAMEQMYSFNYLKTKVPVDYPRMNPSGPTYEWFCERSIKRVLPFANEEYDNLILNAKKS